MDINEALLPFLLAFGCSVLVIIALKRVAAKVGLIDDPGHARHKTHSHPAALVGGISIFISFCFTLLLVNMPIADLKPLFAASILLVIVGVLDDLHELSPLVRFITQIISCCIMIFLGDMVLEHLGELISNFNFNLGLLAIPFTIFAVVGVINAFNMSDGMDGQSGVLAMSVLCILIGLSYLKHDYHNVVILLALAGAVAGFLLFNFRWSASKPATVFMGDAGSMLLGFIISWFLIQLSQGDDAVIKPMTAVWILALPIADTLTVMVRRVVQKKSPLEADRSHYHHFLQGAGCSINFILVLLIVSTFCLGGLAYRIQHLPGGEQFMFYGYIIFLVSYYHWTSKKINNLENQKGPALRGL